MSEYIDEFSAVGGPAVSQMGGDGFEAGPTNKGQYTIAYCGKHSSQRYAEWSKIKWGTPLKEEKGKLYVFEKNKWTPIPHTVQEVKEYHKSLYGIEKIPDKWVFNDFGHQTCYYFVDVNQNRRLDGKERIHGEFIHTTPPNEAEATRGLPVILTESHGCVHVKPSDIDSMQAKGYLKRGNLFIVHDYFEDAPLLKTKKKGTPPFELHFYPKSQKILVKGKVIP